MRRSNRIAMTALLGLFALAAGMSGCRRSTPATAEESVRTAETMENEPEKPKKITIMVDGTVTTKTNDRDAFEKRWEALTGIDLEIIQPDHDAYYDIVGQTFASGVENWPDAILLSPSYYTGYAGEGALWDMTETWERSELKASGRVLGEDVIEGMKLDGRCYGFPVIRGNGCVTYVKKRWLDNVGLSLPTNYAEYLEMLRAFTEEDPDGNGVMGDTYGVSFPGILKAEAPYINYAPEFYQDAYPSFRQAEDGRWYDGFLEENFREALLRLRFAYQQGYIDPESLTNGTKDCRNKFYEDRFGVFTYWAGTWASNLKNNLEANNLDDTLLVLPPIQEVGSYIERSSPVWAITAACEQPEAVFHYLLETMLDGGEMQTLWTYGVEDVHWSTKAETVMGRGYPEGEFHLKESLEKPGTQYTKQYLDPLLTIAAFTNNPGLQPSPEALASQELFYENCRQAVLVPSTDAMASYNGNLNELKDSIVADVVVGGLPIEEAYERFAKEGGEEWSQRIVDSLNARS